MVAAGTKYFQHVTDYHVTMSHGENKLTPKETQNSLYNNGTLSFIPSMYWLYPKDVLHFSL
jgi:hypothetical protein